MHKLCKLEEKRNNLAHKRIKLINSLPNRMLFCCALLFSKSHFSKNSFRDTFRVSNSLDPDLVPN